MESNNIFRENKEIDRLTIQNSLFKAYEQPVYQQVLAQYEHPNLLDIGCHNGSKTVDRFGGQNAARVIGLDYHSGLVTQAQETYGNKDFSFYQCDVEDSRFLEQITLLMAQNGVAAFDIIHISFVLMHLKKPGALLGILRDLLAPGGCLIVVEADDSLSRVSPDEDDLCKSFLDILSLDPFSGNRTCGGKIPALLAENRYQKITLENTLIRATKGELQKKSDIFTTFFSYLPEDILILRRQEPQNTQYAAWSVWLKRHFGALRDLILSDGTEIAMGVSIITCLGE